MKSITISKVAHSMLKTGEGARVKAVASRALTKGTATAKRVAEQTRDRADNLMFDTRRSIKRDPLRTVGVSFAIGFGVAALGAWIALRRFRAHTL